MPLNTEETASAAVENAEHVENSGTDTTPENPAGEQERPKKDGTQRRIDRLTREKYELKARADMLERMLQGGQQENHRQHGLDRSEFSSDQEYLDAVVELKLAEKEQQKTAEKQAVKVQKIVKELESLVEDFDIEDWKSFTITQAMAEAIVDSDSPAKLSAYFYENPEEVERISELPKARQAAAIGRIEAKLEAEPEKKPAAKSSAPAPIKPVAAAKSTQAGYRSDFTMAEYQRWRQANKGSI